MSNGALLSQAELAEEEACGRHLQLANRQQQQYNLSQLDRILLLDCEDNLNGQQLVWNRYLKTAKEEEEEEAEDYEYSLDYLLLCAEGRKNNTDYNSPGLAQFEAIAQLNRHQTAGIEVISDNHNNNIEYLASVNKPPPARTSFAHHLGANNNQRHQLTGPSDASLRMRAPDPFHPDPAVATNLAQLHNPSPLPAHLPHFQHQRQHHHHEQQQQQQQQHQQNLRSQQQLPPHQQILNAHLVAPGKQISAVPPPAVGGGQRTALKLQALPRQLSLPTPGAGTNKQQLPAWPSAGPNYGQQCNDCVHLANGSLANNHHLDEHDDQEEEDEEEDELDHENDDDDEDEQLSDCSCSDSIDCMQLNRHCQHRPLDRLPSSSLANHQRQRNALDCAFTTHHHLYNNQTTTTNNNNHHHHHHHHHRQVHLTLSGEQPLAANFNRPLMPAHPIQPQLPLPPSSLTSNSSPPEPLLALHQHPPLVRHSTYTTSPADSLIVGGHHGRQMMVQPSPLKMTNHHYRQQQGSTSSTIPLTPPPPPVLDRDQQLSDKELSWQDGPNKVASLTRQHKQRQTVSFKRSATADQTTSMIRSNKLQAPNESLGNKPQVRSMGANKGYQQMNGLQTAHDEQMLMADKSALQDRQYKSLQRQQRSPAAAAANGGSVSRSTSQLVAISGSSIIPGPNQAEQHFQRQQASRASPLGLPNATMPAPNQSTGHLVSTPSHFHHQPPVSLTPMAGTHPPASPVPMRAPNNLMGSSTFDGPISLPPITSHRTNSPWMRISSIILTPIGIVIILFIVVSPLLHYLM